MFSHRITEDAELVLIEPRQAEESLAAIERNRERLLPWLTFAEHAKTVEGQREFAKSTLKQFADGKGFQCAILYKGRLSGGIGIHLINTANHSTEIGYWIDKDIEGKGIITSACRAILDHCFGELGINRVGIRCAPGNDRSRSVIERLGAKYEGRERNIFIVQGQPTDQEVFSILKEEWTINPAHKKAFFTHEIDSDTELGLLEPTHADELYSLIDANRKRLRKWLNWVDGTKSPEETGKFICEQLHLHAENNNTVAGIRHKGVLAGVIGLHPVSPICMEIGYWLGEKFQGKGLVTKSCKALIDHAFGDLGMHRIEIRVQPENERSLAVPKRLGFVTEGTLRQVDVDADGNPVDLTIHSLLRGEWKNC